MFTLMAGNAAIVILGCLAVACIEQYLRRRRHSCPLPPGPSGLPWIGNVIGIDAGSPWLTYSKWAKIYGDLIYTQLLGKDVIIINSEKVAKDLLENRALNYSGRPHLITNELCGTDFNSGLLPYGDRWRLHRRFFHQTFRSDAISRFRPLQYRKGCRILQQLLNEPDQLTQHIFDYTSAVIMNSVYNYDPASRKDEITEIVAEALDVIVAAVRPEIALIVGAFPIVLRLPSWLPGMSFKNRMATAKAFANRYVERTFESSVQKLLESGPSPSLVHDSIQKAGKEDAISDEEWTRELKGAAASAFLGGAETSAASIKLFFLMMVLNPDAQVKAQAQIDLVVGGDRLPTIDDRPSLPYVDAILREVYRYNPPTPMGLPHSAAEDDVYCGFHIPKGALLVTNLWSMAHNEYKYPDSAKFIPERFLADDGTLLPLANDIEHVAFGFGRRACPGRCFADASIFSLISSVLAVFHISKRKDDDGVEIPVEPKFSGGISSHPFPFACSIVPRKPGMDAHMLEELIAATTVE